MNDTIERSQTHATFVTGRTFTQQGTVTVSARRRRSATA